MRLQDLDRSGRGNRTRYVGKIDRHHELVLAGSNAAITKSFAEAEFDINVDPKATKASWARELRPASEEEVAALAEVAALERPDELLAKRAPAPPKPAGAAFISVRKTGGKGTSYFVSVSNFFVPAPFSLFGVLPPVCSSFGIVRPRTGDQDLFLHLFHPLGPVVRLSVRGGTLVDIVTFSVFCTPFTHFVPWFQVFGFTSGVCSNFTFGGSDIFG